MDSDDPDFIVVGENVALASSSRSVARELSVDASVARARRATSAWAPSRPTMSAAAHACRYVSRTSGRPLGG